MVISGIMEHLCMKGLTITSFINKEKRVLEPNQ